MKVNVFLTTFLIAICIKCAESFSVIRKTQYGLIGGSTEQSKADASVKYYSFRRVPYAKPPLNELRFQAPVPPEKWDDIKDTTKSIEGCPRFSENFMGPDVIGSEDCLHLDISEPITARKSEDELLPVMVWIHGGTFVFGSINGTGPEYFMEKPVVLILVEYRLNVFGFLSSQDQYAEGNAGLKDQNLALKWVRDNVHNFGGDPDKVTIFGESAGGASVLYHMLSKQSQGLFHQAISQSGTTLNRWAFQADPKKMVTKLAIGLNIQDDDSETVVRKLQEVDFKDLLKVAFNSSVVGFYTPYYAQPFAPTIERESPTAFIAHSTFELLKNGKYTKVPYIAGINTEEGSFGYTYIDNGRVDINLYESNPELIIPASMNIDKGSECHKSTINKIREFYFNNASFTDKANWINFMSEELFVRGIRKTVEFLYGNLPLYTYKFFYVGSRQESYLGGVGHHEEVQYLLYPRLGNAAETKSDTLTRKRFVTLWSNFAIKGNPTPENDELLQNIKWPLAYPNRSTLNIGSNLTVFETSDLEHHRFWDQIFESCGNPPYFIY